ncbi:MAG: Asp-tRNA(Asn)/Glu-tRNA(Gln) amidotransferase GatCAB subunit B [Anaerolinea sp.]|nr:Asp-tRNA(Asn)/Glu-tRNA(Gln) amidotransferase GatCAB subunit B [Anaerolinea sp.]
MVYIPVIGLEIHAELKTQTKMFCGCLVVDSTIAEANSSVCPVCLGLPGALPVVNKKAVELGLRAALALECTPLQYSIFARKNYFYPDLPKGYQISQYETPLAENGRLLIRTSEGEKTIRIRRVHLEEDTGKLTHINRDVDPCSLVDLNRAGVPLLEIVSEPDMHSVEEARAYAVTLHQLLRTIAVSSGDMEKGAIRFEANVSVMLAGAEELGTRTEIKNLNSFRSMERAIEFEIKRHIAILKSNSKVSQETVGWNESEEVTFSQRSKEEAHDYRYFPEPDLPPLVVDSIWLDSILQNIPELPAMKRMRYASEYHLQDAIIDILLEDPRMAFFFEKVVQHGEPAKEATNWITGVLASEVKIRGLDWDCLPIVPGYFADLITLVRRGDINLLTAKTVLSEMLDTGKQPKVIIEQKGLMQIEDGDVIATAVHSVLQGNPKEVANYLAGKETLAQWFFGQVMAKTGGQASPGVVKRELERQLFRLKNELSD